ncbi:MAG: AAA family ATPase [Bacilli bacterium]|nr:AAA family ATPase [Bacilli bacterium]
MRIKVPRFSLIVLVGPNSSGKSSFAEKHFKKSEIVSLDNCRYLISDEARDPQATTKAYELMNEIITKRLSLRKLTVVDATNVLKHQRLELINLANIHHALTVAIVFNLPKDIILANNRQKVFAVDENIIEYQYHQLEDSLATLKQEGFNSVYIINSLEEFMNTEITLVPLFCEKQTETGPFDIIGDVHGCFDELKLLLEKLGYMINKNYHVSHPNGRKVVFVGDLVDRGPKSVEVLKLVMTMVKDGIAFCVQGNHDNKLYRMLAGHNVMVNHGLELTRQELTQESAIFKQEVEAFLKDLPTHLILDDGKLVVAHAGIKEEYIGRHSKEIKAFTLYGDTTKELDEWGLPERRVWAHDYKGNALIVYGHTPNLEPVIINNTINLDTGCVFGNKLTAYRYPEGEFVDVDALRKYASYPRPLR